MKTIEEAAREYAGINKDKYANIAHTYSKLDIADAFSAGLEFAQRWIPVDEELPEIEKQVEALFEGDVDFERSEYVFLKVKGYPHPFVGFYVRESGRCFFDLMYMANALISQLYITHWRPIEIK